MNFSFERAEDSPGFLLWQLTNQWQRLQRQALTKLGLTHVQFVILAGALWLISTSEDSVTQKQVSEFTKVDKMMVSDVVKTLIRKKLLHRMPHEKDGRAHSLDLTTKGRALILKAIPVVETIDNKFFCTKNFAVMQFNEMLNKLFKTNKQGK